MSDSKDPRRHVKLILQNHTITGGLKLGDVRLSDLLNDVHRSFVELDNAALSHLAESGKSIHETSRIVVPKDKVIVAFELNADSDASRRELHYRERRKYSVFLATKDMEIRGLLHATPTEVRPDLSLIQNRWFIPLTQATVTCCSIANCDWAQDAILVNVREIQYLAVGDPIQKEKRLPDGV